MVLYSSSFPLVITLVLISSIHILLAAPAPPTPNNNRIANPITLPRPQPLPQAHPPAHSNSPTSNLTFLGIDCYHLDPTTAHISLETCQPLFAYLVSSGDVYSRHQYWNGWRFKKPGNDPCMITISSPKKGDVTLAISMATIIQSASEVLRECVTGGKDTLGLGEWSVGVSRGVVARGVWVG